MFEYHDHPGDGHEDASAPATDALADPAADAFAEQQLSPLADLSAQADAAPELHFPGDDTALPADADPAAPFPDDAGFTEWLAGHEDSVVDAPAEPLLTAPQDSDELPSSDALVDWTLRKLGEES